MAWHGMAWHGAPLKISESSTMPSTPLSLPSPAPCHSHATLKLYNAIAYVGPAFADHTADQALDKVVCFKWTQLRMCNGQQHVTSKAT